MPTAARAIEPSRTVVTTALGSTTIAARYLSGSKPCTSCMNLGTDTRH